MAFWLVLLGEYRLEGLAFLETKYSDGNLCWIERQVFTGFYRYNSASLAYETVKERVEEGEKPVQRG